MRSGPWTRSRSVVAMAFRTGSDRVADLRVVGCHPEGPGEFGLRPVAPPQGGEGPAADDVDARVLGKIGSLDQPVRLAVQDLAFQPVVPVAHGEEPVGPVEDG